MVKGAGSLKYYFHTIDTSVECKMLHYIRMGTYCASLDGKLPEEFWHLPMFSFPSVAVVVGIVYPQAHEKDKDVST